MGYERGDLGYPDLLAVYRSVYLHIIRRAMWRRFSLTGPNETPREPFTGKRYRGQGDMRADISRPGGGSQVLIAATNMQRLRLVDNIPLARVTYYH